MPDLKSLLSDLREMTKRDYFISEGPLFQLMEKKKDGPKTVSPQLLPQGLCSWISAFNAGVAVGNGAWWICPDCGETCLWSHSDGINGSPMCLTCDAYMELDDNISVRAED